MRNLLITLIVILFSGSLVNAQAPVINSFSPTTGFVGSTVTITGANFDGTAPANNQVFFGSAAGTVLTASFGTLTVSVPSGSTTNLISVRNATTKLIGYSRNHFNANFCSTPLDNSTYAPFNTGAGDQQLGGIYGAYNIDIYDMDGDGKSDIITGSNGNGLTIARNNSTIGTMNFVATNLNTSACVQQFFVADFDGDGKRDIVIAGCSGAFLYPNLSIPGTIIFGPRITLTTATAFYQCAAGDLDNDGKIDFVGGNGAFLYTFRNLSSGPGNFTFSTFNTTVNVGTGCNGIQCVDVDGDGKSDIVATQRSGNRVVALRNTTTTSTFSFAVPQFFSTVSAGPYRLKLGDFDKDGQIDLVTPLYEGAKTCIFRNISTIGTINFQAPLLLAASVNNYRVGVGDVNGDGFPDIVTKPNGVGAFFQVFQNTSTGPGSISFNPLVQYNSAAGAEVGGIAIGDMDGDFVPDIATSGISTNVIRFHRNKSSQVDNTPPTAICKNITVALGPTGTVTVTGSMIDNGSGDACGLAPFKINGQASITYGCNDIGSHTVTLTVTDLANNTATCTAVVTVAPAAIIVSGQTTVCQGQTVLLQANQGGSYQWYLDGNPINGATGQTYTAAVSGSYTVAVTNDPPGCSGVSDPVNVTVNNNPTVNVTPSGSTYLCPPGNNALLTASLSSIYQWQLNNVNISGATQQTYLATTPGSYTVQVIDVFGCSATSDPVIVLANPPEIDIQGNGISIADGDNSPSLTDDTDFGTTYPATPVVKTYTIYNTGISNLIVSSINISGADAANFTLGGISLPATIASGGSATFTVTFNGTSIQIYNAEVTVNNNDCNEAVYNYAIRAEISCVPPVITCPPNVVVNNDPGDCGAIVNYGANEFYSTNNSGTGLAKINVGNGAVTNIGPFGYGGTWALGFKPDGTAWTTVNWGQLASVNLTTGAATPIGAPFGFTSICVDANSSGVLYTLGWNANLYRVNTTTGALTFVANTGLSGVMDIAFDASNKLWAINSSGRLYSINTITGAATLESTLSGGLSLGSEMGLAISPGGTFYMTEWTGSPRLFSVNPATGVTTLISPLAASYPHGGDFSPLGGGATATGIPTPSITYSHPSGSFFPIGTTTVTATATSSCGTASCTFTVTVTDNENPTINCPAPIAVNNDLGVCGALVSYTVTSADNCPGQIVTQTAGLASGSVFPVGVTTNTFVVTDASNNTATCSFTVTVTDDEDPVISVSPVLSCYAANNFGCSINLGASASDNCQLLSLTSDAPACFPVGSTTVTWTATDIYGNTSNATQVVTRNPEINIDICAGITRTIYTGTVNGAGPFGPQSINLTSTVSGGTPGYSYSWSPIAGLNNPFIANPVASPAVTTTYTLTVTDSKGCTRSLSITINVLPLSSAICSGSGNNVKFSVCHIPPGNPSNPQNICISANALDAHLTSGSSGHNNCYLGPCGQQLCFSTVPGAPNFVQSKGAIEEKTAGTPVIVVEEPTGAFKVLAYPNPSAGEFSLKVISNSMEPIRVRIMDMNGTVKSVSNVVSKTNIINVGANLPGGTYMAEVTQGENRQVIKLVKLN